MVVAINNIFEEVVELQEVSLLVEFFVKLSDQEDSFGCNYGLMFMMFGYSDGFGF